VPGLRVRLFGRSSIEVNGQPVKLTPTAMLVLIRLVIADGGMVTVDELCRDVWSRSGAIDRDDRVKVQKRILEIRRAVDREHRGETSQFLRTERGRVSAYRLTLSRDAIDVFEFSDLISQARRAAPELKVDLLRRATALWSGAPLADAADQGWTAQTVRQLHALRRTAPRELMHAYELTGQHDDALDTGQQLSWELPDDGPLAASLAALGEQVRVSRNKRVFREGFTDPDIAVVVMAGDLFAQDDANLAVGFCDTFDTDTDRNIVISGESAQGMLLQRLYGGDRARSTGISRPPSPVCRRRSWKAGRPSPAAS
jgi:DNA-binding SARP family transcriptional activator